MLRTLQTHADVNNSEDPCGHISMTVGQPHMRVTLCDNHLRTKISGRMEHRLMKRVRGGQGVSVRVIEAVPVR